MNINKISVRFHFIRKSYIDTGFRRSALMLFLCTQVVFAQTVSVNFVGQETTPMGVDERAGALESQTSVKSFVANWNNAVGAIGNLQLFDSEGRPSGILMNWKAGHDAWRMKNVADLAGNSRMMRGFIESNESADTVITFSQVPYKGEYLVLVYSDGDNAADFASAKYSIGQAVAYLEDSEFTNFCVANGQNPAGIFQAGAPGEAGLRFVEASIFDPQGNNFEGNVVAFRVSGPEFTLKAIAGEHGSGVFKRSAINGIQIIALQD